ncbi:MFS transporter [Roseovarius phycicola]|uniref:MFS transporter n=1 Tax=Roseovarius phycicola TaxID=3080976 RepID=A0ABZ2HM89_9RHOB
MKIFDFLRGNLPWLSAGMLLTFLSSFGQTFFISIFAGEIRETFSLTHGQWGGIYTLGTAASAMIMVWAGGLTDQFRVRTLAPIILVLLALSCFAMALNPVWWGLILVIFALRFTGQGMTSHIALVAMSRWFIATRGKALSIATLGFAIGEALLPLIFVALMAFIDWRVLWMAAAVLALSGIPFILKLLTEERTPQSVAESSQTAGMDDRHWTRNQAMEHGLFWFMIPALLGPSAFNTAFFFHQVHYADLKGIAHFELVAMYPFYTVVGIVAMMASGWALDRFGTARLIPFMQLPMVIGFVLFAYAGSYTALLSGLFFFALTTGFNTTLPNAFWAEFYGTRHLGSIKAMAAAVMVFGSAIGPGLTGWGIDMGLGLETQYVLVAVYFVFTTGMMFIGIGRAKHRLPRAA